jgi:PadR family transcriptional regulator, regulatory protein PadR
MANHFPSGMELLVLRLLRDEPAGMYGLELVDVSGGSLKRGTVYITLGRMEEKGFVKSKTTAKPNHSGLPRPIYSITALGQRALDAAEVMTGNLAGGASHA